MAPRKMNLITKAWEDALKGQYEEFTLGGFVFEARSDMFYVRKPKGGHISDSDTKRLKANLEKSTTRKWAAMNPKTEGQARFWLIPESSGILQGESLIFLPLFPVKGNQESTTITCHKRDFQKCSIELNETGKHYQYDCRYGTCSECKRTFISLHT